jgi:two-component system chemotaxis sensor kinase CheA
MKLEELTWQVRAEAAERTVAVLKRRLRAIDAGEEKTLIQRQLESAQRRSAEIERQRELAALRGAELERYSAKLEDDVRARTEQIRTVLDHVSSGFLLIGADLRVEAGWSRSCVAMFGTDDIGGRALAELLRWSADRAADFALNVSQVFDDLLPEEVTTAQIPNRALIAGRELELSFSAVRSEGVVARLLATIVDVTARINAEREAKHHRRLVQILMQREAFQMYVTDARRLLDDARHALQEGDQPFVRRAVHTIKGNSATFWLDELATTCHEVESARSIDEGGLATIAAGLVAFLEENRAVLGIDPRADTADAYVLTQRDLDLLIGKARGTDAGEVERFIARLRRRPAEHFVAQIRATVGRLSARLDKDVDFELRGAQVSIDPVQLAPILQCLPHLIRNAVDHGIEPAADRAAKPGRGRVALAFVDGGDLLEIDVEDDGRGIDPKRVAAAAVRKGFLDPDSAENLGVAEAIELLAKDGFSTSTVVTEVSGRGVGLSAVREAVKSAGGRLEIETRLGEGTVFRILVPKLAA